MLKNQGLLAGVMQFQMVISRLSILVKMRGIEFCQLFACYHPSLHTFEKTAVFFLFSKFRNISMYLKVVRFDSISTITHIHICFLVTSWNKFSLFSILQRIYSISKCSSNKLLIYKQRWMNWNRNSNVSVTWLFLGNKFKSIHNRFNTYVS